MKAPRDTQHIAEIAEDLFFLDLLEAFRRAADKYPVDESPTNVAENLMRLTEEELEKLLAERREESCLP